MGPFNMDTFACSGDLLLHVQQNAKASGTKTSKLLAQEVIRADTARYRLSVLASDADTKNVCTIVHGGHELMPFLLQQQSGATRLNRDNQTEKGERT